MRWVALLAVGIARLKISRLSEWKQISPVVKLFREFAADPVELSRFKTFVMRRDWLFSCTAILLGMCICCDFRAGQRA